MDVDKAVVIKEKLRHTGNLSSAGYIVVAEDDEDDRELIRDAFLDTGMSVGMLKFVHDGEELVTSLTLAKKLPRLILLDLNMPRKDGKEALKEIRESNLLRLLPVIIFTTSNSDQDIKQCYTLGANAFITKPSGYQELVNTLTSTKDFWLGHARAPA